MSAEQAALKESASFVYEIQGPSNTRKVGCFSLALLFHRKELVLEVSD